MASSLWEARAMQAGRTLASDLFLARGRKGRRANLEVHLTEREVAAIITAAFQTGAEYAERVLAARDAT